MWRERAKEYAEQRHTEAKRSSRFCQLEWFLIGFFSAASLAILLVVLFR